MISFLFALRQSNVIGGYSFLLTDLLFLSSNVRKLRLNKSKTGRKLLRSPEQFNKFWSVVQPLMESIQHQLDPQTPFSQIINLKLGDFSKALKPFTFHSIRVQSACFLRKNGCDMAELLALGGWTSLQVAEYYALAAE